MPPFLRTAVLQEGINEPLELIPVVIHAAEDFDRRNAILDENYESAINHDEVLSDWLWGVMNDKVEKTRFLL